MNKISILAAMLLLFSSVSFAQTEPEVVPEEEVVETGTIPMDLTDKTTTGLSVFGLSDISGTPTNTSPLIGKTSTGVGLALATGPVGYALSTQHISGTKAFASRHDSTSIHVKDVTTVGTPVLSEIAIDQDFTTDGWKPL